jgi:IS605 OrfB family transposase
MIDIINRTFKVGYKCNDPNWDMHFTESARQQANCIRYCYNRLKEGKTEKEVRFLTKELVEQEEIEIYWLKKGRPSLKNDERYSMPNIAWYRQSALKYTSGIYKSAKTRGQDTIVFGKKLFDKFNKSEIARKKFELGLITEDEFKKVEFTKQDFNKKLKEHRNLSIYLIGETNETGQPRHGNRNFDFIDAKTLIFKPKSGLKFKFEIKPDNRQNYLDGMKYLSDNELTPITIRITKDYLHISFDVAKLPLTKKVNKSNNEHEYTFKQGRVLGIDMNPDRFGFVIKNEERILKAETLDFMNLRLNILKGFRSDDEKKKKLNNKKNHEVKESAHYIVNQAMSYNCEAIILEELTMLPMKSSNKNLNRTCNHDFKKTLFRDTVIKLCNERNIKYIQINPAYTSFFGHIKYHHILSDPCSAAACVADAGIIELERQRKDKKWTNWFQQVKIESSLYNGNEYLNQWKKQDIRFGSMSSLYRSIKKLFSSDSAMSSSYHISKGDQMKQDIWYKTRRSSVIKKILQINPINEASEVGFITSLQGRFGVGVI